MVQLSQTQNLGLTFRAGGGNDRVTGSGSADRIHGDAGKDFLFGGGGNNSLWGDAGNDTLTGGAGNDLFIWHESGGTQSDRVTDFVKGQDHLDLRDLDLEINEVAVIKVGGALYVVAGLFQLNIQVDSSASSLSVGEGAGKDIWI